VYNGRASAGIVVPLCRLGGGYVPGRTLEEPRHIFRQEGDDEGIARVAERGAEHWTSSRLVSRP
jgi:hypothetical protein